MLRALADTTQYAGFIDADLSAPLAEIATLEGELDEYPEAWAAFGSRIKLLGRQVERYATRHYLGRVFATAASLAVGLPVYDSQCGLKMFRAGPEVHAAFEAPFWSRADPGGSKLRLRDFLRVPFQLALVRWRRSR
jgi:hypothetical protein